MPSTISSNLKHLMTQHGLTSRELAKRANVKPSFVYDILSGKSNNPSSVKMLQIAETLCISLDKLVRETLEASSTPSKSACTPSNSAPYIPANRHAHNPPQLAHCLSPAPPAPSPIYFEQAWLEKHTQSNAERLSLVEISDDSMSPHLNPRDMVMVDTNYREAFLPGIYALHYASAVVVKRLDIRPHSHVGTVRLLSDNPHYHPIICDISAIEIVGKVVWVSKWLA